MDDLEPRPFRSWHDPRTVKYNTGTKKIQSEGGAPISQRLVEVSENSNHMM